MRGWMGGVGGWVAGMIAILIVISMCCALCYFLLLFALLLVPQVSIAYFTSPLFILTFLHHRITHPS